MSPKSPSRQSPGKSRAEASRGSYVSSNADEPTRGNFDESAAINEDLAHCFENTKEQDFSGEDIEHGHQLSPLNHSVPPMVTEACDDVPSCNLFPDGSEEYEFWRKVPDRAANSTASSHDNTVTPHKSCAVFDVTPQGPSSKEFKGPLFDAAPISIAPFSGGTAGGPSKPQQESYVVISSREPSPNRDEEKLKSKDEKKLKSKKRAGSPMSAGPKYKKIKADSRMEAMYHHYVMKRYKLKKMKRGEIE